MTAGHPFGDLLGQYRARKSGLTLTHLAELAGYDRSLLGRMCRGGKDLTGPSGRDRVVRLLAVLCEEGAVTTLDEANALLTAAAMPPLFEGQPSEAALLARLAPASRPPILATQRTNLPAHLTRFIGRESEIARVKQLLGETRLLTLTGAGGVGKTRLAIEVGASFAGTTFPDGVWLVELAPLADPALVADAAAAALGLRPGDQTARALLTESLRGKCSLILLDNCEHLVQACAELSEILLRACPHLTLLATSREVLRVPGEVAWHVPPLDTPDPAHLLPLESVADYDAVRLFVDHAAAAQPDFRLAAENAAAVVHICHRLDGIPLAIEMAAATCAAMAPQEIAAKLDGRFALLLSGSRSALPRQQTLRATLDWSYQLLSAPECVLLRRLAVFAGGWTADAAQAVAADADAGTITALAGALGMPDVLPLLLGLVRKSLVAAAVRGDQTRYALLETVRQYAVEKLHEHGEEGAVRDRHLTHYLALAEEMTDIGGQLAEDWVQRVDPEFDNLRAAFACAITRDDRGEAALRLAAALRSYAFHRGHIGEGLAWLDAALACGGAASAPACARALLAKAALSVVLGNLVGAAGTAEAGLALFRQTDDRVGTAWCLELLANIVLDERAQERAEEALSLFRAVGSRDGEARALRALGTRAYRAGDPTRAACYLERAAAINREIGNTKDLRICLDRLYDVRPRRALELCAREAARWREIGDEENLADFLSAHGVLLVAEGEHERAKRTLEEVVHLGQRTGLITAFGQAWDFTQALLALGLAEASLGHPRRAALCWEQARELAREAGIMLVSDVARFLVAAGVDQGAPLDCLRRFHGYGYRPGVVCALVLAADAARRDADARRAAVLLGAAGAFGAAAETINYPLDRFPCLWHHYARRAVVEPTLAAARTKLGDAEFEAAYALGQQMTLDQAVAYALQEGDLDESPIG